MPFVCQTLWAKVSETYNFSLVDTNAQMASVSKGFCNQMKEICRETCEQLAKFQPRAILLSLSYQSRNGFITEILSDGFSAGSHSSRHTMNSLPIWSGLLCPSSGL